MSLHWMPWGPSFSAGLLPEHRIWDTSILVFAQVWLLKIIGSNVYDPAVALFSSPTDFIWELWSCHQVIMSLLPSSCTFFAHQASSKEGYCDFFLLKNRHRALENSFHVQSLGRKLWEGILTSKSGAEQGLLRIRWPGWRLMSERWIWVCGEWLL